MRKRSNRSYDNPNDPWNTSTYQTGSTTPPKSHSGIIAALLVLVIVLCGVVTVLGITNVRLFHQLDNQTLETDLPITFSADRYASSFRGLKTDAQEKTAGACGLLGLDGESVPQLYQLYYHLPQGFYITFVLPDCAADTAGLQPGDIITAVNDQAVTGPQELAEALQALNDTRVTLNIYRGTRKFQVELPLEKA